MTKMMKNLRNGKIAEIIDENEIETCLRYEDGTEKIVKAATIRRWFKAIEAPVAPKIIEAPQEEIKEEIILESAPENMIEEHAILNNGIVVAWNVKGRKCLKINGSMYAVIRYSGKGIELWLRMAAISEEIKDKIDLKSANHMFDARVKFSKIEGNEDIILNLLDASMSYQLAKKANTKKAKAAAAKVAKASAKGEECA